MSLENTITTEEKIESSSNTDVLKRSLITLFLAPIVFFSGNTDTYAY